MLSPKLYRKLVSRNSLVVKCHDSAKVLIPIMLSTSVLESSLYSVQASGLLEVIETPRGQFLRKGGSNMGTDCV